MPPIAISVAATYTVLNGNANDPFLVGVDEVAKITCAIAKAVTSLMDVDQDREVLGIRRGIDIQEEAVLITAGNGLAARDRGHELGAHSTEL